MRTAEACATKADEMDRLAVLCGVPNLADHYRQMAGDWRNVALQAMWQDVPRYAGQIWADPLPW